MSKAFRIRRIAGVAVAAWSISMLIPAAASATAPTTTRFSFQQPGRIDCGTFSDNFVDYYSVTETTFYDTQGNATRVVDQVTHTSNDVNSVTGLTLHEHGHVTVTFYPATGVLVVDGLQLIMTRPGNGIVVVADGRRLFDADGNLVQRSGQSQADDQDYCNGLS